MSAGTGPTPGGRNHLRKLCPDVRCAARRPYLPIPRIETESAASVRAGSCAGTAHFAEQPSLCEAYVAGHRGRRGAHGGGDLVVCHPAEIMQLNDLREPRFELQQALERLIERDDIDFDQRRCRARFLCDQIANAGIAFEARARLRMIHQYPAHQPRGQRKKVSAVLQIDIRLNQAKKRLVYDRGGLQRVAAAFLAHMAPRQATQFVVHQWGQAVECLGLAGAPFSEQLREIGRDLHRHYSQPRKGFGSRHRLRLSPKHTLFGNVRGITIDCRLSKQTTHVVSATSVFGNFSIGSNHYESQSNRFGSGLCGSKFRFCRYGHTADPAAARKSAGHTAHPAAARKSAGYTTDPAAARKRAGYTAHPAAACKRAGYTAHPAAACKRAGYTAHPAAACKRAGYTAHPAAA